MRHELVDTHSGTKRNKENISNCEMMEIDFFYYFSVYL